MSAVRGSAALFFPLIHDDEAISGWIYRASLRRGIQPGAIGKLIGHVGATTDLDFKRGRREQREHVAKLARQSARFRSWDDGDEYTVLGDKYMSFLHTDYEKNARPILRFCAHCWAEDAEPYYRKSWRYTFSYVCERHCAPLARACGACGAVVDVRKLGFALVANVGYCGSCGDCLFRHAASMQDHAQWTALVSLQRWLTCVVESTRGLSGGQLAEIGGIALDRHLLVDIRESGFKRMNFNLGSLCEIDWTSIAKEVPCVPTNARGSSFELPQARKYALPGLENVRSALMAAFGPGEIGLRRRVLPPAPIPSQLHMKAHDSGLATHFRRTPYILKPDQGPNDVL